LDFTMLMAYDNLSRVLKRRYTSCCETAVSRSTGSTMAKQMGEKLFREEFSQLDLQKSLIDVLEKRYLLPGVVMKVMYETIASLQQHMPNHPHTRVYLQTLCGTLDPCVGHCVAIVLHLLSSFWPMSESKYDDNVSDKEISLIVSGLYPSELCKAVNADEVVADMLIASHKHLSQRNARAYFYNTVMSHEEPLLRKSYELMMFKVGAVHWSELDSSDFWDGIHAVVGDERQVEAQLRHAYACCIYQKPSRLAPSQLAFIAGVLQWEVIAMQRVRQL
jgi:hypothetical protein